jgi:hypothetical protein
MYQSRESRKLGRPIKGQKGCFVKSGRQTRNNIWKDEHDDDDKSKLPSACFLHYL